MWRLVALMVLSACGGDTTTMQTQMPQCPAGRGPLCLSQQLPDSLAIGQGFACCRGGTEGMIAPGATTGWVIAYGPHSAWFGCFPTQQDAANYAQNSTTLTNPTYVFCDK